MATKDFKVRAPDGSVITVRAPDTATQEQVFKFAKMQFEKRIASQDANQVDSADRDALDGRALASERRGRANSRGLAGRISQQRREDYLTELEKTNPFQAKALREMGGFERAGVSLGAGFADVLAGIGLRDRSEGEKIALEQAEKGLSGFGAGRTIGQFAPFAAGGAALGSMMKGAGIGAQALTQGALGAAEGNIIARGTGGSGEDILAATVGGALIGGGAEVLGPAVNRAARALVRKLRGKPPVGILIDEAGRPTKELQSALAESGTTFDELVQEASQGADSVESVVKAGRGGSESAAVENISEGVNVGRLEAAERLGLGDAPLGVVSDDMATQELAGILSAVPGSRASVALNEFTDEFGRRADQYIEELGGSIDRGMIDQDLLVNMQSDINRIKALENTLYDRIRSDIGEETIVNAQPLKNLLSARARTVQGVKNLSKVERDVLDRVKDGKITYAGLDDVISDVGAALGRETDAYSTVQRAKLADMYSNLSRLREGVAETFGHKTDLTRAKKLGAARFGLQESSTALFGKDLQKSIFPRIDRTVKGLERGSIREFRATMELIPEKFRKPVAATMLNTALTGGRNQSLGVNSGQFAKWYKNLSRNESAMNELRKYVGDDAVSRLDDIANLAQGVANVTGSRVRTGVAGESLKRLDDIDGIVGKIYGAAQKAQGAPVVGRAAAVVGNTAKTLTMEKTPAIEAAQDIIGSKRFVDAVKEAAKAGTDSRKFRRLNSQLKATKEYKKYINQLNDDAKAQIAASGLIAWLASDKEEE